MKSTKETIKYLLASAYSLFSSRHQKSVLYYHSVKPEDIENFRCQMRYLAEHCQVVRTSAILNAELSDRPVVAVTFDDGFVSCYDNATAIMQEYKIPAGIFVPTGYIGRQCGWYMPKGHPDQKEMIIDADQIKMLQASGFEILSHTVNHPNLTKVDSDTLKKELLDSKETLTELLGECVDIISYPHGAHNQDVIRAAKECGYRMGFSIEPERVDQRKDDLMIGRFLVSPKDSIARLKLKSEGAYMTEQLLRLMKRQLKR